MTSIQYQPAATDGWLAIVSQNRALVIETADDSFVREAWIAVASEGAVQAVLELLTRRGLSSTPAFAFVVLGEDARLRVVLRGSLSVSVSDASGDHLLSSDGVSTWLERIFDETSGATITATGSTAAAIGSLPLVSGVAWVSSVSLGSTTAGAGIDAPAEVVAAAVSAMPSERISELDAPVPAPVVAPAAPTVHSVPVSAEIPESAAAEPASVVPPKTAPELDLEATVTDTQLEQQAPPPPPPAAEASGYDYLFGDTMYRSVADAAVREPEETDEPEPAVAAVVEGDHDGHTVLTSDIQRVRGRRDADAPVTAPPPPPVAATISIVQPGGPRTALTHTVIIGRSPSVSKVSGEFIPTLLTIGGDQDISRNHAQVSLEGGTPVVTDLHSRNGTSVVLPGRSPQRLRAGEATAVIVGTVIDLGGGVTLTLEED